MVTHGIDVIVLDGSSEYSVHVRRNIGNLNGVMHLFKWTVPSNLQTIYKKNTGVLYTK